MDYNILVLAIFLGSNNPAGNDFESNVSFYVDYALNLTNAGFDYVATPAQIEQVPSEYPHLASKSLAELLQYS